MAGFETLAFLEWSPVVAVTDRSCWCFPQDLHIAVRHAKVESVFIAASQVCLLTVCLSICWLLWRILGFPDSSTEETRQRFTQCRAMAIKPFGKLGFCKMTQYNSVLTESSCSCSWSEWDCRSPIWEVPWLHDSNPTVWVRWWWGKASVLCWTVWSWWFCSISLQVLHGPRWEFPFL